MRKNNRDKRTKRFFRSPASSSSIFLHASNPISCRSSPLQLNDGNQFKPTLFRLESRGINLDRRYPGSVPTSCKWNFFRGNPISRGSIGNGSRVRDRHLVYGWQSVESRHREVGRCTQTTERNVPIRLFYIYLYRYIDIYMYIYICMYYIYIYICITWRLGST